MIRRACAVLAVGLVLTACSDDEPRPGVGRASAPATTGTSGPSGPSGPSDAQYVALGDSYAAAPGVPPADAAGGCFRSGANYAQLLAEAEDLTVDDVTCSGATSESVLDDQVPAVGPETELVTVGVGGNDFDLFTHLLRTCLDAASGDAPCTDGLGAEVRDTVPRIADNIGTVLDGVVEAAPDAQVVVVGYPALLPEEGSCPDLVPLAPDDYPFVNEVTQALSDALRTEADERDLEFLDLVGPSQGHDICSDEPWVNGAQVAPDGTIPFHPLAAEQQAVAGLLAGFL